MPSRRPIAAQQLPPRMNLPLPRLGARAFALLLVAAFAAATSRADIVTDWNAAIGVAQKNLAQPASTQARSTAIMNAAIFDAVNGIVKKYDPYRVAQPAPAGANAEAAAIHAAYTAALGLYPTQKTAVLDPQLAASLAALNAPADAIASGRAWGEAVAQQILDWRASDGFSVAASHVGTDAVGAWRHTATPATSGTGVQLATMLPFALASPRQFRPARPYGAADVAAAVKTAAYAADFNDVKAVGSATSATRTTEQGNIAQLWHAADNADENRVLRSLVPPAATLVDNARLFTLASMAATDAVVVAYDVKYAYPFWRPITGIRLADTDDNAATAPDAAWTPLIATPQHPEYISAHSIITGAMLGTGARILGDAQTFTLSSPGFPSYTRTYGSISAACEEVGLSRVWGGIHYRASCNVGRDLGAAISAYVVGNFLRPRAAATEAPARMANFSTRASVSASGAMITGFVVEGTRQKNILIRGVGPTLAQFGVSGVLADPKLELFTGANQRLAENDDWPAALASAFASAGGFALPAASKDAAVLLPLQPGAYTVVLRSATSAAGEALLEIYEAP